MIEKLQQGEFREAKIADKVNELINGYNELHKKLDPLVAIITNDRTVTWEYDPTLVPLSDLIPDSDEE